MGEGGLKYKVNLAVHRSFSTYPVSNSVSYWKAQLPLLWSFHALKSPNS